jgi:hypothetical protein
MDSQPSLEDITRQLEAVRAVEAVRIRSGEQIYNRAKDFEIAWFTTADGDVASRIERLAEMVHKSLGQTLMLATYRWERTPNPNPQEGELPALPMLVYSHADFSKVLGELVINPKDGELVIPVCGKRSGVETYSVDLPRGPEKKPLYVTEGNWEIPAIKLLQILEGTAGHYELVQEGAMEVSPLRTALFLGDRDILSATEGVAPNLRDSYDEFFNFSRFRRKGDALYQGNPDQTPPVKPA